MPTFLPKHINILLFFIDVGLKQHAFVDLNDGNKLVTSL